MITYNTRRRTCDRMESEFHSDSRTPELRSVQLLNSPARPAQHRSSVRRTREPPTLPNGKVELLADIEALAALVRLLVQNASAEIQSDTVHAGPDINSLLSSTLEKMVERMRGSPQRRDAPSNQPLAIVEVISSGEPSVQPPTLSNETVLRVGPLELDLLDRTAKRGDRQIDLRPREFQLLKYMMQRSDKLLTRAALLKDVWHYKFVPETNLVDVHMGRVRRKVDGSNEAPMIRNVRGVGFVLSAASFPQGPTRGVSEALPN